MAIITASIRNFAQVKFTKITMMIKDHLVMFITSAVNASDSL